MQEAVRRRVLISGRVQGVAFRAATRARARTGALAGWVRNLADGRVEAVFEGEPAAVAALVAWCEQGPSGARVDRIEVRDEAPEGLPDFRVR
jgi:acylphosphatase